MIIGEREKYENRDLEITTCHSLEDITEVVRKAPFGGQDVQYILKNRKVKAYKPGTLWALWPGVLK